MHETSELFGGNKKKLCQAFVAGFGSLFVFIA